MLFKTFLDISIFTLKNISVLLFFSEETKFLLLADSEQKHKCVV